MENLNFLIAAYTVIWAIIGFYIFLLIKRNRKLLNQVEDLETRIRDIENRSGQT